MKVLIVVAVALLVVAQLASAACHNATGSCTAHGFVCANEETVAHHKRCNGVEDCADGTDEYLCDIAPTPIMDLAPHARNAIVEVSCVKCTCAKGSITLTSGSTATWWHIAEYAPRDVTMMTNAPAQGNKPCNLAQVTSITLNVYKKQNKGCRGWVCCFRQQSCNACSGTGTPATHCW